MRNSTIYIGAIVIGVIALIVGILYYTQALGLGYHPTRAYAALGIGIVLVIIGMVGMVVARRR